MVVSAVDNHFLAPLGYHAIIVMLSPIFMPIDMHREQKEMYFVYSNVKYEYISTEFH